MKEIVIKVKDDIYEKARNEFYGENKVSASMVNEIFSAVFHGISSVNPQPKTGHWIIIDDCEKFIAKCSECGQIEDSRMIGKYAYCHCGARMVKPQESEE